MSQHLVGRPVGGITPEMELKRFQAELAQRKSSVLRLKILIAVEAVTANMPMMKTARIKAKDLLFTFASLF